MKLFIDTLSKDAPQLKTPELYETLEHEATCINEDCSGKISYLLKQVYDGSAVICKKCNKSIILTVEEL